MERPPTRARREEGAALLDPLLRAAPAPRRAGGRKRGALERFERLLAAGWARARALALVDARPEAAVDATGFESRHVSLHFRIRRGREAGRRRHKRAWPKLTIVSHSATHLIAAAVPSRGPSQDAAEFAPALRQARRVLAIHRLLADAAYDAEHNHTLCRQELGIRSTAIRLNPRSTGRKWPKTRYRRQMRRRFPKRQYRQRWQVESTFSQHKRRLGSALTARGDAARAAEERLRALTHNLMILRRAAKGFQQSNTKTMTEPEPPFEVAFGPCCFCGSLIPETAPDPCRVTVETAAGEWQVWFCHGECFKARLTSAWDLAPAHF